MRFIGIDLGTSFIKGAVLNVDSGRVEHVRRIPFPEALPGLDPRYCEFAPAQVLAATRSLIEELATIPGVAGVHIMAPGNDAAIPEVIAGVRAKVT